MYVLVALLLLAVGLWAFQGQRSNIRRDGQRLPFVYSHTFLQAAMPNILIDVLLVPCR